MTLTLCSLLSKETGLTVTVVCVVYDYCILHKVCGVGVWVCGCVVGMVLYHMLACGVQCTVVVAVLWV